MAALVDTVPVTELVGVFAGVVLGQGLSMWWDRRLEREARAGRAADARESLAAELDEVERRLSAWADPADLPPDARFSSAAYESSVASGRFSLLEGAEQRAVTAAYDVAERVEEFGREHRAAERRDDDPAYRRRLSVEFGERVDELERRIEGARGELR